MKQKTIPIPNAILFIMDAETENIPALPAGSVFACSHDAISLGTLHAVDGETKISVVELVPEYTKPFVTEFSTTLTIPSGRLWIATVGPQPIFVLNVPNKQVRIIVSINDDKEPNEVVVAVGSAVI